MTDFVNLQVYGVPIATFGLVGITTAILAYTTATSGMQDAVESLTEVTTNTLSPVISMNPLASISESSLNLSPIESAFKEGEPTEEPPKEELPPEALNVAPTEVPTQEENKGGKRRRRKTPKNRKPKNKSSNKKSKK